MEKSFLISQGALQIPCTLTMPDGGPIRRVVLGAHGLGGSGNDPIQSGIAGEMILFQSAVVRFDFPGHGKSPLDCRELTLANCVETLVAVAQWVKGRFPVLKDLCVFATGFGAYVTLIALDALLELPGRIKLVVQTPSVRMHDTLLAMTGLSAPTLRALDAYSFPAERPLTVTYRLYEELRKNIALNTYPIPILILHGEEDDYIRTEDVRHFRRINDQAKLVIIPGTSHRFQEDGAWDMVLDLTRDWFDFEQVLLTEWE